MATALELTMEDTMPAAYDPATVHRLLKNGTRSEILHLLQHKIDLNCTNEDGDTVVHSILRNDKLIERHILEILTTVLDQNVNPNTSNNQEQIGLHLAVERRMKDTINFLLKFEADVNTANRYGNSIAHFFIEDEHEKRKMAIRYPMMNTLENREMMEKDSIRFLEFLLSKDVDFDRRNRQGNSALHLAIMYQLLHILPALLERTNDIKFIDRDNTTLLHLFLEGISQSTNEHPHSSYDSKYTANCVEILLDRGVPILGSTNYSCTLISNAIKTREQMDIIGTLINYYLKKCDDKNLATILFYELLSTCTLWNEWDIDYFLTVLCDLIIKGININHELLVGKRFLLPQRVSGNSMFFDFVKQSGIQYSIRSSYDKSLLHMLADQRNYQGSSDELYNHICDLVFCGNCEVNALDERGKSVLQTAIGSGNFQMIPILIELGADINNRDDTMRTPLHDAVMMNEALNVVGLLLSKGADVNAKDNEGDAPLHLAACNNKVPIVGLLLQNGALVDSRNKYQKTPLHSISWESDVAEETMDLLLSNGADVNAKDQEGETPLHLAASNHNVSIVQKLIEIGALVTCETKDHQTPLHYALSTNAFVEVADLLLSNGADVNVADSKGETPLHLAVSHGSMVIVQKLMQLGASVNCKNQYEKTPLHRAVINCDMEIVYLLLSKGVDVNAEDQTNETPLHLAVSHNNVAIVKLLLDHGACVNSQNKQQQTPLHRVRWRCDGAAEIVELLLESGADVNAKSAWGEVPLNCAFSQNNASLALLLLQHDASVDFKNKYQQTPLHRALTMNAAVEVVKSLLARGADVNAKDYVGMTPLHEAVTNNDLSIVRLLIEHGASVDCKDKYWQTPLHRALSMDAGVAIVELLVESEADVNAKDHEGNRPLHHVLRRWTLDDNEYVMKMLLRKGAYVNARNNDGESALYQALSLKNRVLVDELLMYGADLNERNVRWFMLSTPCQLHQHILRQYLVKLKAVDLPFHGEYEAQANDTAYEEYHEKCLREVVKLKETFIGNHTSLYDFLHKRSTIRDAHTSSDKLKQLVESSRLEELFPEYSVMILAGYHEAVTRTTLLKAAQKGLHELIQVQLPNTDYNILDYLGDEDLINIIEANVDDAALTMNEMGGEGIVK